MNNNAWCDIKPKDYDAHSSHPDAGQMQMLSKITKEQFELLPKGHDAIAAILGITNGNGLEHVIPCGIAKMIGIDINEAFLKECRERYPELESRLSLHRLDLIADVMKSVEILSECDLIIANLLIKHIHLDNFSNIIKRLPKHGQIVSCVIQFDPDGVAVSKTGFEHIFNGVSLQREVENENRIIDSMNQNGFTLTNRSGYDLPNEKQFIRLDFIAE